VCELFCSVWVCVFTLTTPWSKGWGSWRLAIQDGFALYHQGNLFKCMNWRDYLVFILFISFAFWNCDLYLSPILNFGFSSCGSICLQFSNLGFFFSKCGSISLQFSTCVFPSVDVCLVVVAFRSPWRCTLFFSHCKQFFRRGFVLLDNMVFFPSG
jgi:hypothetical protein